MKWINAGDIRYWVTARRRHCEQTIPELIRRLISATAPTIVKIDFPSGDSVTTAGWDGYLDTPSMSPFFPTGISGWEMGVDATPGKKAAKDYATRTRKPLGLTKRDSTFVFVTPRAWPGRSKFEIEKRRKKAWKDIRTVAADGLEQWLESAPAVALWLARQLDKAPDSIRDLEAAWEEWSSATDPVMIPDVVSTGRAEQVERLHQWLAGAPGLLEMQGDSSDEALAFLFAAIVQLAEPAKTRALSRCLIVENINQLRACLAFPPLIIAAPAQCREAVGLAIQKGHHVFLIADSNTIDFSGRLVQLPRPKRSVLEAALRKNRFSDTDAHRLARDSGASIPVLRRHIFRASIGAPDWAKPENAPLLLPVLLASAWIDNQEGDRAIIEALAGRPYEEFTQQLEPLLSVNDAPLRKVANVWMLKSPLDAWFLVARHLDGEHLKRFRDVAMKVLGEVDPKYELDPDKRWAAAIYDKQPRFSEWIQQGLVKSLVLLGVHGERTGAVAGREFADVITMDILTAADSWQAWSSLKEITPLLAEAAPHAFLDVLETELRENPTSFVELMRDDGTTFGECKHSGLLWALESLAWDPDYLSRAIRILGSLAALDPGGSWSNRPANSLRDIFLLGIPQTYASPQIRLESFDGLTSQSPELAWKVAEGIMTGGSISASHQFRWRPYPGQRDPLEQDDAEAHREYVEGLIPRINRVLSLSPDNLIGAVGDFTRIEVSQDAVLQALTEVEPSSLSDGQREQLLKNLRQVLHWINTYGNQDQKTRGQALAQALERFSPSNLLERYGWLLGNAWPNLPEGEPQDYGENEKLKSERREEAARLVLDQTPLKEIVDYAAKVAYVGVFGHAFGRVVRDEKEDASFLDFVLTSSPVNEGLVLGYAMSRVEVAGPQWILATFTRLHGQGLDAPEAIALLYLSLPENKHIWTAVAAHGPAVESAYWKRARGRSGIEPEDAAIAVDKLLDAARPDAALSVAGNPKASISSSLLQRLLQALLSFDPKEKPIDGAMFRYHLGFVFKQLYERNELALEEIAKIEWPFAQILGDDFGRYTSQPLAIHRVLQHDPSFFALLVSFLYKRDDGSIEPAPENLDEKQKENMRNNARQVLHSWHLMPGLAEDGSVDGKVLLEWVEAARKQCADTHHVTGGDLQIAQILARSPSDPDGAWPHKAVRDVIEKLQNPMIDRHIPITVHNDRGATSRGILDGGAQERVLAKRYEDMGKTLAATWPRAAAILNTIAKSYYSAAGREDTLTDLRDLSWG
jgi:hypothetical protein